MILIKHFYLLSPTSEYRIHWQTGSVITAGAGNVMEEVVVEPFP